MSLSRSGVELDNLLARYGVDPASNPARQMRAYSGLLEKWNARVNLTASTDWENVGPLFEEAIWAAQYYPGGRLRHLDIGSGAGFPALPLRVLRPEMRLEMVESRSRRCAFLETVIAELGLAGVRVLNARLEDHLACRAGQEGWDIVSWKAIRLGKRELRLLLRCCSEDTRYWLFHSQRSPSEDPELLESTMSLESRTSCPARGGWFLSVYARRGCRDVSRET